MIFLSIKKKIRFIINLVSKYDVLFYIGIEPTKKLVWFYKDEDFSKLPLGVIDFNEEYPIKSIYPLDDIDVAMAARRASLAILKGEFPNSIGFYS